MEMMTMTNPGLLSLSTFVLLALAPASSGCIFSWDDTAGGTASAPLSAELMLLEVDGVPVDTSGLVAIGEHYDESVSFALTTQAAIDASPSDMPLSTGIFEEGFWLSLSVCPIEEVLEASMNGEALLEDGLLSLSLCDGPECAWADHGALSIAAEEDAQGGRVLTVDGTLDDGRDVSVAFRYEY